MQLLTDELRSEVLSWHSRYEQVSRETLMEGAELGYFKPYEGLVLKAVLGMYCYSYLWIKPNPPEAAQAIAERFNELTLRMALTA